jgi:hypothetical protein
MIDLPGQVTSFNRFPRGSFRCNPVVGLTANASTNSSSACSQSLHRNGYHAHKIRMSNVLNCCIETHSKNILATIVLVQIGEMDSQQMVCGPQFPMLWRYANAVLLALRLVDL